MGDNKTEDIRQKFDAICGWCKPATKFKFSEDDIKVDRYGRYINCVKCGGYLYIPDALSKK